MAPPGQEEVAIDSGKLDALTLSDSANSQSGTGATNGSNTGSSTAGAVVEDPEKKAKKDAKAAEKAAKKAKAEAKAAAAKAAAAQPKADNSKKAQLKAEAEAKKAKEAEEVKELIAHARATPSGAKKDIGAEMPKGYCPPAVEAAWYDWWEKCGYFKPNPESDKEPFVIVIPPPNVTGALHLGHALTNAIQDAVVRWRRMKGYNTLWVPGTDHAGISTQIVVEKKLQRERGLTRHDLGREAFLEELYMWVGQYKGHIRDQLRRTGSSVDWSRLVFTMDEPRARAVKEAFLRMHADGCIYRENRLVNWDCTLKTAVSDIEVKHLELTGRTLIAVPGYKAPVEFGVIASFAYPLEDGSGELVVATTRIETMLGDTAIAVHPDDPRYTHLHGKHAVHPVDGRRIPIITDAKLVDMSFGTGAVKITPAHDPNDFETGQRHKLQFINILDDSGNINERGGPFAGRPRFEVRQTITQFLEQKGLYRGIKDNPMSLGISDRSNDVIEPLMKPQWWVDCKQMAADAMAAARDGRLQLIPKEAEATWFRWLGEIRDWCISRQLWWGHRIPAYYVSIKGEPACAPGSPNERLDRWLAAPDEAAALEKAQALFPGQSVSVSQDEDVLDTWFSSGLFPFSVMGWPDKTLDLQKFFPGSLLETGRDILFFWVARMVMLSMKLTGEVPFKTVYLHSMVRDAHGRKMSKSLGNVLDPVDVIEGISLEELHAKLLTGNLDAKEVAQATAGQKSDFPDGIEECGTDALRFALVSYTSQGRDINLDIKKVVAYRHWCNKLWNAIKFAMMNLGAGFVPSPTVDASALPFSGRWILSRLNAAVEAVDRSMEAYEFGSATQAIYAFWQYELCDVFIELTKPVLSADAGSGADIAGQQRGLREALWLCLDTGLRILHPFMPFVTEELWQRLPKRGDQAGHASIMVTPFPTPDPALASPQAEAEMEAVQRVVVRVRSLRADYGLQKERPAVFLQCSDAAAGSMLAQRCAEIATLSTSSRAEVLQEGQAPPKGCGVAIVDDVTTVHLLLVGILDPAKELQKLEKKRAEVTGRLQALRKKVGLPGYADKTPAKVQSDDADKVAKTEAELAAVEHHYADMQTLVSQ